MKPAVTVVVLLAVPQMVLPAESFSLSFDEANGRAVPPGWTDCNEPDDRRPAVPQAKLTPLKVLFIGNSYTSVNDLPAMAAVLAEAAGGRKIKVDRHLVGGCTLEKHVEDRKAIDKIRATKWDVVVLQEQSLRPVIDRKSMHTYARVLDDEIEQQGAKTVFYLTWARQHIPEMQEGADPDKSPEYTRAMYEISGAAKTIALETWLQQQKAGLAAGLNGAYLDIAKELEAGVAPVGIAWKMALAADPPFVLHRPDKSHPNPTGTYLAACVFYATLLDANPVGLPGKILHGDKVLAEIPDEQAKRLQKIAWAAVSSDSRPVARTPFLPERTQGDGAHPFHLKARVVAPLARRWMVAQGDAGSHPADQPGIHKESRRHRGMEQTSAGTESQLAGRQPQRQGRPWRALQQ